MHFLKYRTFSLPQSEAYHLNWRTNHARSSRLGFIASFESERIFFMGLLQKKLSKIRFSQHWWTLLKTFDAVVHILKVTWASWSPMDCLEEQLRFFQGTIDLRKLVWPSYSIVVELYSFLFSPLAIICCTSVHMKKYFVCVSPKISQALLSCHVTSALRKKITQSTFPPRLIENTRLFGMIFCFQIRVSLLHAAFVNYCNHAALRRNFPNSDWLSLTFEITKFSNSAKLCLKLW